MSTQSTSDDLALLAGNPTARPIFPLPAEAVPPLYATIDFMLIVALSVANGFAYHQFVFGQFGDTELYAGLGMVVGAFVVAIFYAKGIYDIAGHSFRPAQIALLWTLVFAFLTTAGFMLKVSEQFSRGSVASFYATGATVLILAHLVMDRILRRAFADGSLLGRRIVVVAEPQELEGGGLLETLKKHGCKIEKLVTLRGTSNDQSLADRLDCSAEDLVRQIRQTGADEVVLAVDWSHAPDLSGLQAILRGAPVPVRLLPDLTTRDLLNRPKTKIGPLIAVEIQRAPLSRIERVVKRSMDVTFAASGLFFLLPFLAAVAIAVRLDSRGPVLFRQHRMGFNGVPFRIYKFRTMTTMDDSDVVVQARRNDPRVTRVGRWLRSSSVDELPQLINVLKGEMSLVGPRPHALAHDNTYDKIIARYALRYHVKPGITGWAQASGYRGETPTVDLMERRVEHDLWYIENWSLMLDARILVKTVIRELKKQDAY